MCQVVAQFRIIAFHGVGFPLPFRDFVSLAVVPQPMIDVKGITVV